MGERHLDHDAGVEGNHHLVELNFHVPQDFGVIELIVLQLRLVALHTLLFM